MRSTSPHDIPSEASNCIRLMSLHVPRQWCCRQVGYKPSYRDAGGLDEDMDWNRQKVSQSAYTSWRDAEPVSTGTRLGLGEYLLGHEPEIGDEQETSIDEDEDNLHL